MGSIVSLNTTVVIDTDETCEVTVAALESKITALGDAYFGDSANWSSIQVQYRSTTGRQKETVSMDVVLPTSSGVFRVSDKARQEGWVISSIRVYDFDGDYYTVEKSDMIGTDYDEPTVSSSAAVAYYENGFDAAISTGYEFLSSGMSIQGFSSELTYTHGSNATGTFTVIVQDGSNGYSDTTAAAAIPTSSLTNDFSVEIDMNTINIPGFGAMAGGSIECVIGITDQNSLNLVESTPVTLVADNVNTLTVLKTALQSGLCNEIGTVSVKFTSKTSGGTPTTDFGTSWFADSVKFIAN